MQLPQLELDPQQGPLQSIKMLPLTRKLLMLAWMCFLFIFIRNLYTTPLLMQHPVANICQRRTYKKWFRPLKRLIHTEPMCFSYHIRRQAKPCAQFIHTLTHERLWPQLIGSSMHNNSIG